MSNEKWKQPKYAENKEGFLVFRVSSESKAGISYNVQLDCKIDHLRTEYNGKCDCENFTIQCNPNFKRNGFQIVPYGPKKKNRTQCKHIEKAKREFNRLVICSMSIERRKAANEAYR